LGCCIGFGAYAAPARFVVSHFNVALDHATYDAIRTASDIEAFAASESRSTVAGADKFSGFYVYGRRTYMEFFDEDALPDHTHVGDFNIGLSVEEVAGIQPLIQRLQTRYGSAEVEVGDQVRTTAVGDVPWFKYAALKSDEGASATVWFSEFDPRYLATMHPEAHIAHPLSREENLASHFRPQQQLDDIIGLELMLAALDSAHIESLLAIAGWRVKRHAHGFTATGPEFKIETRAATHSALRAVEFRLQHKVLRRDSLLGRALLHVEGKRGVLQFSPRP